jgi:hypothetical protein
MTRLPMTRRGLASILPILVLLACRTTAPPAAPEPAVPEPAARDPVAGAGTIDVPQYYSYVDTAIDPYQNYYYYVESISFGGVRERFTPVITAKAKLPPKEGASSPP